ncbi:hypothetical protein QYM36_018046 [Artemia franciscana]|uniref:Uncharacterized protein n=1 Tax=Artemia franciscana TaxID=6661 RepID=A0AA88HDQ8_ARTSF|nr:hypothetical protein QYM36_018046 [Artemia franciscana]
MKGVEAGTRHVKSAMVAVSEANCQKIIQNMGQTPDLLPTQFEAAKQLYLRKMKPSIDQLKKLPVITVGQADNPKWISKRMETISSTRFHSICVRRPATSSARLVKEIVTGKQMYYNWQMNHGVD